MPIFVGGMLETTSLDPDLEREEWIGVEPVTQEFSSDGGRRGTVDDRVFLSDN